MKKIKFIIVFFTLIFNLQNIAFCEDYKTTDSIEINNYLKQHEVIINEYSIAKELLDNYLLIYTTIISALMLFFTIIVSFIIPRNLKWIISNKVNKISHKLGEIETELSAGLIKIYETNVIATRSLYEDKDNSTFWKYIWSSRLVFAIKDLYNVRPSNNLKKDLIKRIKIAKEDLDKLSDKQIIELKNFENISDVITYWKNLSIESDKEIQEISTEMLISFLNIIKK